MLMQEAVFSVAVETTCPQFTIAQPEGKTMKRICEWHDEKGCSSVTGNMFTAGSLAEGLTLRTGWGHPQSGINNMVLLAGPLSVQVPQTGCQAQECALLTYRDAGCPSVYCKIEVTDEQTLMSVNVEGKQLDEMCIHRSEGVAWLRTQNMLWLLQDSNTKTIRAPACKSRGGKTKYVPTLVCSDTHPDIDQNYMLRTRHGWPSSQQLAVIKQLPMLLVLTGHKNSAEFPLQARVSWSHSEMELLISLPLHIKQIYIVLKYAFKCLMKEFRGTNMSNYGRNPVGSYCLKTVLLNHLERIGGPATIGSKLALLHGLLYDLDLCLRVGNIPHHFIPNCNLLEKVASHERRIARNVIKRIQYDPLRAILMCPTTPKHIYGEVQPETLVVAFHQVSFHMTSASCKDLLKLLLHIDVKRWPLLRLWQHTHLEYFQAEPKGLMNMLWEQIQGY